MNFNLYGQTPTTLTEEEKKILKATGDSSLDFTEEEAKEAHKNKGVPYMRSYSTDISTRLAEEESQLYSMIKTKRLKLKQGYKKALIEKDEKDINFIIDRPNKSYKYENKTIASLVKNSPYLCYFDEPDSDPITLYTIGMHIFDKGLKYLESMSVNGKKSYNDLFNAQLKKIAEFNTESKFDHLPYQHLECLSFAFESAMSAKDPDYKNILHQEEYLETVGNVSSFVMSLVYSVIEYDYNTYNIIKDKHHKDMLPDWLLNFVLVISKDDDPIYIAKERDDDTFDDDKDRAILELAYDVMEYIEDEIRRDGESTEEFIRTYCDYKDKTYNDYAIMMVMSYVEALIVYALQIYTDSFSPDCHHDLYHKLTDLWTMPMYVIDATYSSYLHLRVDEVLIDSNVNALKLAMTITSSIQELLKKETTHSELLNDYHNHIQYSDSWTSQPQSQIPGSRFNPSAQPPYLNMRLNQLETTVNSLVRENAELKGRLDKLETSYASKDQSSISESDKEESCVHNDYVAYLYNNDYPKIDPFKKGADMEYEKWKSGMSGPVLNYFRHSIYNMSIESDDGTVIRHKCNLCGKHFVIDRRLITFSK